MLLSLIAIMIFFQFMTNGTLLKPLNLTNLILQNSYIIIMALGMLLVIVAGHIDLSVGSVVRLHRRARGRHDGPVQDPLHPDDASSAWRSAALIGAAQGYWVAFFKIPSFIVTLAGMLVFKGLTLALLAGQSVGPFPPEFQKLSSGFIPDIFGGMRWTARNGPVTSSCSASRSGADPDLLELPQPPDRQKHGVEEEPLLFFVGEERWSSRLVVMFWASCWRPIKACPTS